MADWSDVSRLALALPATSERMTRGDLEWRVGEKLFVWERPLRKSDLLALGDRAPTGPILGARVADLGEKEALLAQEPELLFTTPHFDGYCAVLVRLDAITVAVLEPIVIEAWLARAPSQLATEYLSSP